VDYALSGWFGGAGTQADSASLLARFLDAGGIAVGSNIVGNITAADRGGVITLLEQSTNGTLPHGTRFVEFILTNHVATGMNDASADNLSFVVSPRPDAPFSIVAYGGANKGWRVEINTLTNRLYVLERSADLAAWAPVTSPTTGSGNPLSLTDTNAPSGQTFYRVASRRP
jgi:hypothetical protein